ncbi:MAG: hypothetical protein EAZ14_11610 [Runella slithyformis]|nr:MAG: hypothetical protein EAZ14_11610 [Runella slithyformis]
MPQTYGKTFGTVIFCGVNLILGHKNQAIVSVHTDDKRIFIFQAIVSVHTDDKRIFQAIVSVHTDDKRIFIFPDHCQCPH